MDSGSYGTKGGDWRKHVGDWTPDPERFPRGLRPIRESTRCKGMLLGLWVEPETISSESHLAQEHLDWFTMRHRKRLHQIGESWRGPLDLSRAEVAAWMEQEIVRLIEEHELDLFRLDYNVGFLYEGGRSDRDGWCESTQWRYYENLYAIFDRVRARYPHVNLQQCAGGGGRSDLGMVGRFHENCLTDATRIPRTLRIFNGMTLAVPPERFIIATGLPGDRGNPVTQLRLGAVLSHPWLCGIAPNLQVLTPERKQTYKHHVKLYKQFVRPFVADCRVYHHAPVSARRDDQEWFVLEYAAADASRALAVVARLATGGGDSFCFKPRGLCPGSRYRVTFDNTQHALDMTGVELMNTGVGLRLESVLSSELLLFEAV